MATFWSESTKGFYIDHIHGDNMPADVVECTEAERQAAIDGQDGENQIGLNSEGRPANIPRPIPAVSLRRSIAKKRIDQAAGAARVRFVSEGDFISVEYQQAEQQAGEWLAAGQSSENIPADVQAWANASGLTPQEAAQDIQQTAGSWRLVLSQIRAIRLEAKAAIDNAADDNIRGDMEAIAEPFIQQLEALQP